MESELAKRIARSALFLYASTTLFSMTIAFVAFVGIRLFSIPDHSARAKQHRAGFLARQV